MKTISIAVTENTPKIMCDFENSLIEISGRSIPENANEFYIPLIRWLKDYGNSDKQSLKLIFFLDYINSISYKMIFEILIIAEEIKKGNKDVSVLWKYEEDDDEILEEGSHFASKLDIPFTFEEIPEED